MKRIFSTLTLFLAFAAPLVAQPTTPAEVFQAHVDAVGGVDAWTGVERSYMKGEVSIALPNGIISIGLEAWNIYPGYSFREMKEKQSMPGMPQMDSKIYLSPDGGWMENFQGRTDLSSAPPEMAAAMKPPTKDALEELGLLADDSTEVVLLEPETVRGTLANVVEVRGAVTSKRFYDAETGILFAIEAPGQMGTPARTYVSDYREVDGRKMAFKQMTDMGQFQQTVSMSTVEFNGDFDTDTVKAAAGESE